MLKREDEASVKARQGWHVLTAVSLSTLHETKQHLLFEDNHTAGEFLLWDGQESAGGEILVSGVPLRVNKWQQPRGRSHSLTRLRILELKQKPHGRAHHVS